MRVLNDTARVAALLIAVLTLVAVQSEARAVVIIDDDVEGNGDNSAITGTITTAWAGWGGVVAFPAFLNGPVFDDHDLALGGAAIEVGNGNTPFANNGSSQSVTYGGLTAEGTYTLLLQVGNYNNAGFPTLSGFTFAAQTPDSTGANSAVASGGDEIYSFTFDIDAGETGLPLSFGVNVGGSGNYLIDHLQVDFESAAAESSAPEPSSLILVSISLVGLGLTRRRRQSRLSTGSA